MNQCSETHSKLFSNLQSWTKSLGHWCNVTNYLRFTTKVWEKRCYSFKTALLFPPPDLIKCWKSEVGRSRNNWKRSILQELERVGYCWGRAKHSLRTVCVGGYWWTPYAPPGLLIDKDDDIPSALTRETKLGVNWKSTYQGKLVIKQQRGTYGRLTSWKCSCFVGVN